MAYQGKGETEAKWEEKARWPVTRGSAMIVVEEQHSKSGRLRRRRDNQTEPQLSGRKAQGHKDDC